MDMNDKAIVSSTLAAYGVTNVGSVRDNNEDTFMVEDLPSSPTGEAPAAAMAPSDQRLLMMVCDGMGGAAAGEVAARIAADSVRNALVVLGPSPDGHAGDSLTAAMAVANQSILDEVQRHPEERGMGTTCTVALVIENKLVVGQIGDSRAYLLHEGSLRALTATSPL